jgi:hypothetical protein
VCGSNISTHHRGSSKAAAAGVVRQMTASLMRANYDITVQQKKANIDITVQQKKVNNEVRIKTLITTHQPSLFISCGKEKDQTGMQKNRKQKTKKGGSTVLYTEISSSWRCTVQ